MIGLSLALSALLVLLNGVFVGYEFAIVKSSRYRLEALAASGKRGAATALHHKERLNEFLAVCQLGITAVTLALTIAFEPAVEALLEPVLHAFMSEGTAHVVSIGLALFIATSIHVTFGELIPKSLALLSPEPLVAQLAGLINILYRIARGPIWFFNGLSTYITRVVTGKEPGSESNEEIDVRQSLHDSHQTGKIDDTQLELFDAVLEYPERMVREVMTPRLDVVSIDLDDPIEEILRHVTDNFYTRYPVMSKGNVEGYVIIHDLFTDPHLNAIDCERALRPIPKLPETLTLPRVQSALDSSPIAAVFDEYNEFVGIITHADIDAEIVGELLDEDDDAELPIIQSAPDGSHLVNAAESVEEVLAALGTSINDSELEGIDTFGGLLLTRLGREPTNGDEVELGGFRFVILETDRFRIHRVRAIRMASEAGPNEADLDEGSDVG